MSFTFGSGPDTITAYVTAGFYQKLVDHPRMQRAEKKFLKRKMAKSHGAQWKREQKGLP